MGKKCFVPGCKSGYDSSKNEEKTQISVFHAPKDSLDEWKRAIPRKDKELQEKDVVCETHFDPTDIIKDDIFHLPGGIMERIPRIKAALKKGAIPRIFPNLPKYLTNTLKRRPPPKERAFRNPSQKSPKKLKPTPTNEKQPEEHTEADFTDQIQSIQEVVHADITDHTYAIPESEEFTLETIHVIAPAITLTGSMWGVHQVPGKKTAIVHLNDKLDCDKSILFTNSRQPTIEIMKKEVDFPEVKSRKELEQLVHDVDILMPCLGSSDTTRSRACAGFVVPKDMHRKRQPRCLSCATERRRRQKLKPKKIKNRCTILAKKLALRGQQKRRLIKRLTSLKQKLGSIMDKYQALSRQQLDDYVQVLPPKQREVVNACIKAAKCKSQKGMQYNPEWVYECLLMRMKSPKLYRKMRRDNILPLPAYTTLQRYIKKLHPIYGFHEATFKVMGQKASHLSEAERHGSLLLDEMQLTKAVSFSRGSLQVEGIVFLGDHTPEKQKDKLGDHALVLMYQPFRGKWIQAIGAFLSAGAVPGSTLEKLVTEGIILLENEGYHVDTVVTDGATWNRTMGNNFGVGKNNSSCVHPADPSRRLWFASDFPHLLKSLWTRVVNQKQLKLPNGEINLHHWKAVLDADCIPKKGIKICYKLSGDHIHPKIYQKMNVRMAFQFFSHHVASAMEHYKVQGNPHLADSAATIEFIRLINAVSDAMNSQEPREALRPDPLSTHHKVLTNFLKYLEDCEKVKAPKTMLITDSTHLGLLVTIRTAIELVQYLSKEVGYDFLMTRRINQDNLEHFFGNCRDGCGSSFHPDPTLFIQVYRLLSTYLVKPPRGSNVTGGELLTMITSLKDVIGDEYKQRRSELEKKIDEIIDCGFTMEGDFMANEHDYVSAKIDPHALTVFCGYVSRKMRMKNCESCFKAVCASENHVPEDREGFLQLLSKGYLLTPSNEMYCLVYEMERVIAQLLQSENLHKNALFSILETLMYSSDIIEVGCNEHKLELTKKIISFYVICRMHFACAALNADNEEKKRKKNLAKQSKL